MATNENSDDIHPAGGGDLPVPDLRAIELLCQPTLNGRGDDVNKHLDKFLHVTQSIKVNGVTDDALRLYLFPRSLTHHATAWFDRLPRNSITTFAQMAKMFLGKYFPPSMDTSVQRSESSSSITYFSNQEIVVLKAEMVKINKNLMKVLKINQQVKAVTHNCETYGGPHSYNDCPATVGQTQNHQRRLTSSCPPIPNFEPVVAPVVKPVEAPVSSSKPNLKPLIPYPSRIHDQKLRDKANDRNEKFFQIFQYLNFNISFANALILMPKFGLTIYSLLTNKEKLFELARTLLNVHCLAVILKKLPEKLGDPGKFPIPCDFPGIDECLALADLGVSKNLMPLSMWNKLSLPELSPTCMALELADRLISRPVRVTEDVFVKTDCALIDVYEGELTLRVGKEAVTFNLDQTLRYSTNYDAIDFLLEEIDAFLAIDDEPISPEINDSFYDSEGDILFLEEFLNDDASSPPLPPQELKVVK
nr:reverse transcriptase domain-containing protein [Tanacetum cinerariifolium]